MAEGWIKIHRKLQDSKIWSTRRQPFDYRSAWIDLLMMANHRDSEIIVDYETITVKRGQLMTSVRQLSERWQWSKERVCKYLRLIESEKMVTKSSTTRWTLLTIENYEVYQCDQDTGQDTERTQSGHGSATNKNIKNEKKDINNIYINNNRGFKPPSVEEVKSYCLERNNSVDPEAFVCFYESKGWMIGKNKMKDWKAAVRTWEKSRKSVSQSKPEVNTKIHNFEERDYDFDELMNVATRK